MKVVLAGASGAGKTTLAKALAEHFSIPFVENSAGLILSQAAKDSLQFKWGYDGNWGQRKVINESHRNPEFGYDFQQWILKSRTELIGGYENGVFDRSPLDAMVFYMNQVVHNFSDISAKDFLNSCIYNFAKAGITHVIYVPLQNPGNTIENNGSRCDNFYFQSKVDLLFDWVVNKQFFKGMQSINFVNPEKGNEDLTIKLHTVKTWDWQERKEAAIRFLIKNKA